MTRQIRYFGIESPWLEHWFPYSDEKLFEIVKEFAERLSKQIKINLCYCWQTDYKCFLWVVVSKVDPDFSTDKDYIVWVNDYNNERDDPTEIQKEAHRIKRTLKRHFPDYKVTSRLSLQ